MAAAVPITTMALSPAVLCGVRRVLPGMPLVMFSVIRGCDGLLVGLHGVLLCVMFGVMV
jgi:hypothetical protein